MRNQSWLNLRKDANYLITGASSGIGLATTKALLDFGCSVTGCVRDTKSIIELCEKYPNFSDIEYNAKEEINLLKEKIKFMMKCGETAALETYTDVNLQFIGIMF